MVTPSEEVTKTWVKHKGILVKSRPEPSRFSFAVCLAMVFSIAFGFLGGFITAGFALNENYSSVYENLLAELENTRRFVEREREELQSMKRAIGAPQVSNNVESASIRNIGTNKPNNQVHNQAIFSVFGHAVDLFQKNDKDGGCAELNNIINLNGYSGEWRAKAQYLLNKNCN